MKTIEKIIIILISIIFVICSACYADVGSFEDYDSGSSWDSDWDSGSSWDWDSDSDWDSDHRTVAGYFPLPILWGGDVGSIIFIFFVVLIITIIKSKIGIRRKRNDYTNINFTPKTIYEDNLVENKIKQIDPEFSKEEFQSFAKEVFIKLQNAWTDRDWEKIRPFESKELFEQHKAQLEGYIKNNQINVMERICVNWVHLLTFEQYGGKDILKIDLNSRMGDYIIDATTKKVVRGDKTKEYYHTYTLTFIRTTGTLTKKGESMFKTTNCPNCGAPTTITSSGRCEYCNSVITTEEHGWVLSNLTRKN